MSGNSRVSKSVVNDRFNISPVVMAQFCEKHHIHRLALFGSVLREDFGPDSDIDVLVEFEVGHVPGLFRLVGMEHELSDIAGGRRIDMRTPEDLSRYFREDVVTSAEALYG